MGSRGVLVFGLDEEGGLKRFKVVETAGESSGAVTYGPGQVLAFLSLAGLFPGDDQKTVVLVAGCVAWRTWVSLLLGTSVLEGHHGLTAPHPPGILVGGTVHVPPVESQLPTSIGQDGQTPAATLLLFLLPPARLGCKRNTYSPGSCCDGNDDRSSPPSVQMVS